MLSERNCLKQASLSCVKLFLNFESKLLKLQEVSKASDYAPSRTFYLFRVDMPQVARLLLNRCYQVIALRDAYFVILT